MIKNLNVILIALIIFCVAVPFISPGDVVLADGEERYEYWTTSDDAVVVVYGPNWFGQTFTTEEDVPHTITKVRLKLARGGSPGTLLVEIYETDAGSHPEGGPIGAGDISGDTFSTSGTWYTIYLDESVTLQANVKYAIVIHADSATASDNITWSYDDGDGYADGAEESSTDGGVSWSTTAANDMMFEVWGESAMGILTSRVFESVLESNDQLFVFSYQVFPEASYENKIPRNYFNLQVVINTTIQGQVKLPAWGYKPGGIYLSADQALPWGTNLTGIRLEGVGDFAGIGDTYVLSGEEWSGGDLYSLDDWIIATASALEDWYSEDIIATTQDGQYILTTTGGTMFLLGIPGLNTIRPDLFGITPEDDQPSKKTHTTTWADELEGGFGEGWDSAMDDIGDLVGVEADFVGGSIWLYIIVLGMSCLGIAIGNPAISIACVALPLAIVGVGLGTLPLQWLLLPIFLVGFWAILKLTGVKFG